MRKAELIPLLSGLPDDIEIVTGDSDMGRFFDPTVARTRAKTLWLLMTFNPIDGRWYRDYFDDENAAQREWQHALDAGWKPKSLEPLQCLNICG